jgi:hypothetical protein
LIQVKFGAASDRKGSAEGAEIISYLELVELGTDDDGDAITTASVRPSEATPGRRQKPVSGAAKIALDLLYKALVEAGKVPPPSEHIPPDTGTCPVELWRAHCYAGMIAETDKGALRKRLLPERRASCKSLV